MPGLHAARRSRNQIVRVLVLVLEGLVQSVTKHRPGDEANKSNM